MIDNDLESLLATIEDKPFKPYVEFSPQADAMTCYFHPDADYSKRLNNHVTLFVSIETERLVGCRIKGIKGLIERLPNYIEVNHEGYELKCIFWSFMGGENPENQNTLDRLSEESRGLRLQLN